MDATTRKALAALTLAISAEKIGNDSECEAAALMAGRLARKAGHSTEMVYRTMMIEAGEYMTRTWYFVCDGMVE